MYIIHLIVLLSIFISSNANASDSLSRKEIIEDLEILDKNLRKLHPNLFTYSSPEEVDRYFSEIKKTIPDSVSQEFAFELVAGASQIIKDGHTIFLPSAASIEYNSVNDNFFPFDIYWDGDQMFVQRNYSQDTSIRVGTIISKIDDLKIKEIVERLTNVLPHDGDNLSYSNWIINTYFSSYYNFVFGSIEQIELSYNHNSYLINALPKTQINEIKNRIFQDIDGQKPLTLIIDTNLSTATIKISDFHNSVIKSNDQKFKKIMATFFSKIEEKNIQNLILDFRDNQGGSLRNGRILLSYLLKEKYKLVEQYYRVREKNAHDPKGRLRKSLRDIAIVSRPRNSSFKGKVYVIINGGAFSNTGMVCACLDRRNRALFVGQETGGSASLLSSDSKQITLPNSGISVQIPTLQFVLPEYPEGKNGGVKPDFYLTPTVSDMIQNKDIELIEIKKRIEKQFTTIVADAQP